MKNALNLLILTAGLLWLTGCPVPPDQAAKDVTGKVSTKYKKERTRLIAQNKNLQADLTAQRKKNQDLKKIIADLKKELRELQQRNLELGQNRLNGLKNPPTLNRPVTGKILAINGGRNLIILSVGQKTGITPGMEFNVYRNDELIGKILVDRVEKEWATGHCVNRAELPRLKLGDQVSNRLE